MKAQEVELALEEVEKAGEEQAKFGKCREKKNCCVSISCQYKIYHILQNAFSTHIERCCILALFQGLT